MTEHKPSEARTIERIEIDSSNLKSVGYDADRRIMAVEFLSSGHVLHYDGVGPDVFEAFGLAESRGKFYAKQIKGKFSARPMTGLCPRCAFLGYIGEQCEHCKEATVREIDRTHKAP